MLHTKFRGTWPTGSGKEDLLKVFTIYGRGGHLGHVTSIILINLSFLVLKSIHVHTKLGKISSLVSKKSKIIIWKAQGVPQ